MQHLQQDLGTHRLCSTYTEAEHRPFLSKAATICYLQLTKDKAAVNTSSVHRKPKSKRIVHP